MNQKTKICTSCNRELPLNSDYYFVRSDKPGGFNNRCKECCGRKFTNKLTHIPKIGYAFCKKCDRELPHTFQYFPVDKGCKTGLRYVCRECNPSYGRFLEDGEAPNEEWSEEEKELLKNVYKDYTNRELIEKFFQNRTVRSIESMASVLGFSGKTEETYLRSVAFRSKLISEAMIGRTLNEECRRKISETKKEYFKNHDGWWKGKKRSKEQCRIISKNAKERGYWKGENNPRHINPLKGDQNGRWKGGIVNIYQELRSDTKDWFNESMEYCNYSCVITNGDFDNVHHTTTFKDIVEEVFEITKLDTRPQVKDYSEEDMSLLRDVLKKLHVFYGFGACINKEVHKLFHDLYGYTNITAYDFMDFVYRIDCGEFDKWFDENNLSIDINYNYIEYLENKINELEEKVG